MRMPRTAYVALWFPKPSETFVASEVRALHQAGLSISVHSLYGALRNTDELTPEGVPVERLGMRAAPRVLLAFLTFLVQEPLTTLGLMGRTLFSRGHSLEKYGENLLAVLCGFSLARRFQSLGIEHIHAAWACGSATAAWCASSLTGIPFSFSGRAGDVHPPDGLLSLKLRQAAFARVDSAYNLPHLRSFIPGDPGKIHLVYNACTLGQDLRCLPEAPVPMSNPLKLVAIGRFVETKGFQYLIESLALLRERGVVVHLTLAGDGAWRGRLKDLTQKLSLSESVRFPGFVPHTGVSAMLCEADMLVMPSVLRPNGSGDGLPTVIAEAFLHRLPVVATNVASIPDLVLHGQTGLLVSERDPKALADAIEWMAKNRAEALAMAAGGRERTLQMFAPGTCATRLIELLAGNAQRNKACAERE